MQLESKGVVATVRNRRLKMVKKKKNKKKKKQKVC
jgi:hypothetical protein